MSNLSNSKKEVWDRLKNGIVPDDDCDDLETTIAKNMAKNLADEIDKKIIKDLAALYGYSE